MPRFSRFATLLLFTAPLWAQARPKVISPAEAQQLEESLKTNPDDKVARENLLDYYFSPIKIEASQIIEARRRHILWVIKNAPGDQIAGSPVVTIDASGHRLADAEGYKQAAEAWRAVVARKDVTVEMLVNAAFFFKLPEREYAIGLLEKAQKLDPKNENVAGFLGVEYGMSILGVTMVNKNGYPMAADPKLTDSPLAKKARAALDATDNVYELNRAGYILSFQGSVLRSTGKLPFDYVPVAAKYLQRAVTLDPYNSYARQLLDQLEQLKSISTGNK